MKLLIITQKIDSKDPILGFFHQWIIEFSKKCESIVAVCLEEGMHGFPPTITVLSLGKEKKHSRIQYISRLYRYLWNERTQYDAVFVHMNQEYVLLGWVLWKILGKKIMMWRNHPRGTMVTRIAVLLSDKVFCTSPQSFTARFKKTEIVSAGIDTDIFVPPSIENRPAGSIMYVGRISSIKNVHLLTQASNILNEKGIEFAVSLYGGAVDLPEEQIYFDSMKRDALGLESKGKMVFHGPISNDQLPDLYAHNEILVNMTQAGSFDKVVLEMMACGGMVLVSNSSFESVMPAVWKDALMFVHNDPIDLAVKLERLMLLPREGKERIGLACREMVVRNHSLSLLAYQIFRS